MKPVETPVGHELDGLAKILYPMMKEWQILRMEAVIPGEKGRAPKGTWVARGGIELRVDITLQT